MSKRCASHLAQQQFPSHAEKEAGKPCILSEVGGFDSDRGAAASFDEVGAPKTMLLEVHQDSLRFCPTISTDESDAALMHTLDPGKSDHAILPSAAPTGQSVSTTQSNTVPAFHLFGASVGSVQCRL